MIPDIPQIRDSLAALRVREAAPVVGNERQLTICENCRRIYPDHTVAEDETAIVLTQDQSAPMALPRVIDRIAEELYRQGHAHSMPKTDRRLSVASKFVGLAVAIRPLFANPLDAINLLLQNVSEAGVIQWAVLVNPSTGADQYHFGDFAYGELSLETLRSRCERAGSNFFELHGNRLRGRRSIYRDSREIEVLDTNSIKLPGTLDSAAQSITYRLNDEYFGDISEGEQRLFMADLDRQQAVYGAAGLGTIPSDTLLRLSALTQWITVFTRQQRLHGCVVPNQTFFEVSTTEPRALAEGHGEIRST